MSLPNLVAQFEAQNLTITQFLHWILVDSAYRSHVLVRDLCNHAPDICNVLDITSKSLLSQNSAIGQSPVAHWAISTTVDYFQQELRTLMNSGLWRFGASSANASQIENFRLEAMAKEMKHTAPVMWGAVTGLLEGQGSGALDMLAVARPTDEKAMEDDEPDLWESVGELPDLGDAIESVIEDEQTKEQRNRAMKRTLTTVKAVVLFSIILQHTNRKFNTLESIIGIFLHSCGTPERVINTLARMGLSISIDSIHKAISSLSTESAEKNRDLGQTLTVAYCYDNFDIDLKHSVPTIDKSQSTLKHLTSALTFPLLHDVVADDLKCSAALWQTSPLNPRLAVPPRPGSWMDLVREIVGKKSITHDDFNAWKFLADLCDYGPSYFAQFREQVGEPKSVEPIPVVRTSINALRSMEFSNSTVAGNISTIVDVLAQGGVGDPTNKDTQFIVKDMSEHVVLFHGDLGTGDRIATIQQRRSIEASPWNRFQFVIFLPGLFHVKTSQ